MTLLPAQGIRLQANSPRQRPSVYSYTTTPQTSTSVANLSSSNNSNQPSTSVSTDTSPKTEASNINSTKSYSKCFISNTCSNFRRKALHLYTDWKTDWWGLELLSWAISALSLLTIFVILQKHKGKPLPEWPLSITVNSLVSVFSTISQMAMMTPVVECISQLKWLWYVRTSKRLADFKEFDNASRGPTGSLILLGKLRGIHLISLGAVISVISIAFGPISQQVVAYPLLLRAVGNASVQQARFLTFPVNQVTLEDINPVLVAALQDGLNGETKTLSTVVPSCTTGNCTWNTYSSLGICASTVDISSMLINNTCNRAALDANFLTSFGLPNPGFPCFNYSLPASLYNPIPIFVPFKGATSNPEYEFTNKASMTNVQEDDISEDVNMPILSISTGFYSNYSLVDINILYQPGIETSINLTLPLPVAIRSSLKLCVQKFNTTVFDSNTTTEQVSSKSFDLSDTEYTNFTFFENGTTFGWDTLTLSYFKGFFIDNIPDWCSFIVFSADSFSYLTSCHSTAASTIFKKFNTTKDPVSAVNSVMENVAISLTNSFRSGAGGWVQVTQAQGTAYLPVAFVETNYLWFTLPIGLVLLTLIFLIATITKSQRLGAKTWKSSNFTTMQGLHKDVHDALGGLESLSAMEERVQDVMVKLDLEAGVRNRGGWRLVRSK